VIELRRPLSGAPPQLLRVHLGRGELVEAWSPTHALERVIAPTNVVGPALADKLNAHDALQGDLVGWAKRMVAAGPPWADDVLAYSPGGERIVYAAGRSTWAAHANGSGTGNVGPAGHARMAPNGRVAAWAAVADRVSAATAKVVIMDFDAGNMPFIVQGVASPQDLTWSPDSKTLYAAGVTVPDAGPAEACLFAIDPHAQAVKKLACAGGGERFVAFSPSVKLAVLAAHAAEPSKVYTDLVFVSLPDGAVKKQVRIPVEGRGGIVDDDGVYAVEARGPSALLTVVDMASGRKTFAKEVGEPLVPGGWIAKRSFVGLRTDKDVLRIDRVDVDHLASTPVPDAPK